MTPNFRFQCHDICQHLITQKVYTIEAYCQLVANAHVRQLRSVDIRTLVVTQMRSSFGDRTFATAGPQSGTVCGPISDCGLSFLFGQ